MGHLFPAIHPTVGVYLAGIKCLLAHGTELGTGEISDPCFMLRVGAETWPRVILRYVARVASVSIASED